MEQGLNPFGPAGYFYECLRWHDDRWWVSDMHGGAVTSLSPDGEARIEVEIAGKPSGLGWHPDGSLLIVSMNERQLLRRTPEDKVEVFADLASLTGDAPGFLNDMWVTDKGHAYIGFDLDPNKTHASEGLILHVAPDGRAEIAARDLAFPNGIVATADGATLIVAQTFRPEFLSFSIDTTGRLGPASVWADLSGRDDCRKDRSRSLGSEEVMLDGCYMDGDGSMWAADIGSACIRVAPGGAIQDAVFLPDGLFPFACGLGGPDGHQLVICAADRDVAGRKLKKGSQMYTISVERPAIAAS